MLNAFPLFLIFETDQDADQTQLLKTSLSSRVKDMRRSRSIDITTLKDLMSHTGRVVKQGILDVHATTTKHVNNLQDIADGFVGQVVESASAEPVGHLQVCPIFINIFSIKFTY